MSRLLLPASLLSAALHAAEPAGLSPVPLDASLLREQIAVKAVCGHCHTLEIVMDTPMGYEEWRGTVQKMVDQGARGTDEQFDDIMDFLYRTMTTVNVNTADADALGSILGVSDAAAQAIVARRAQRKIADLADLKTVPGVSAQGLDSRARLIFF